MPVSTAEARRITFGERDLRQGMRELVSAGDLGAKTGKGFYEHG